jgi:transcriptional regulator with XRE-family HTH domain
MDFQANVDREEADKSDLGVKSSDFTGSYPTRELVSRAKSSLRLKYEAEASVIQIKLGDLEAIREKLGLTQRKISQLLMVDPSAWTRWTRSGENAPPHIYRMLQWYLALEEKYPALDIGFWLSAVSRSGEPALIAAQDEKLHELTAEVEKLQAEISKIRVDSWGAVRRADESQKSLAAYQANMRRKAIWMGILIVLSLGFFAGFFASRLSM